MISEEERDIFIIRKILKYCDRIDEHFKNFGNDYEIFKINVSFQDAVSMSIQQIGEQAKRLSDEFTKSHNGIPWNMVRGMRNMLAHEYEHTNFDEIWSTATNDIPALREFCEGVIKIEQSTKNE